MTKADIIKEIAKTTKLTSMEIKHVVDNTFSVIKASVANNQRIELRGFGVFHSKVRKPRMARNPKTGAPVQIDEHSVPVFKPSPDFYKKVNEKMAPAEAPAAPMM